MPASVEKCVQSTLTSLKKQYPKRSEKALTRMAWAICQDQYNKQKKKGKETMPESHKIEWNGKVKVFHTLTEAMIGLDREEHQIVEHEDVSDILVDESEFVEVDCHGLAGDSASNYAIPRLKALPYKSSSGPNAACVRNALARFNQVKGATDAEKASAKRKLLSAAKKLGIKTSGESEDLDDDEITVDGSDSTGYVLDSLTLSGSTFTEATEASVIEESPHIFIRGTAIGEGVTRNLNEYLAEELQRAAPTLVDVPLQVDHGRLTANNAGRVLVASFDPKTKSIDYIARLRKTSEAYEPVAHGDVDSVSIGANISDVLCNICGESKLNGSCNHHVGREYEGEIATRIGIGLEFFELSITPFGAYKGADIAGVTARHSVTLDDAVALFTESWIEKFGNERKMSEPENDPKAEFELSKAQKELETEKQEKLKLQEHVKETLARTIADSEIEMGERKSDDLKKRVELLKAKTVEALDDISETTRERLLSFRHDTSVASRSQGIVSEDDDEPEDPTSVDREELKKFLRQEWMHWPEPSDKAKRTVRQFRSNSYNPMHQEFARLEKERGR